jgi:phosphoglycolate phosphatase
MTHLIAFDFDGVLCDSLQSHLRAYQAVFSLFNKKWPLDSHKVWKENYQGSWEINYLGNGFTESEMAVAQKRYYDFIDYSDAVVFQGIPALLESLSKIATLAVVTTTRKDIVLKKLCENGLAGYFAGIFTDSSKSNKTGSLRAAAATLGFTYENTVMIGDTEGDIQAAKSLNIPIISVSYGWYSTERLNALKPDYIADSPEKIREILAKLL